jgi:hypothetical protein
MPRPASVRLSLEPLETRENPSILVSEAFDAVAPPALPVGWAAWSSDGSSVFRTAAGLGTGGTNALVSQAGSRTTGLTWGWGTQLIPADATVSASIKLDTLVPESLFTRGQNLGTPTPSYLAAVVTRGVSVQIVEVSGAFTRVLASVSSPPAAYYNGWAKVSLVANGNSVAVQLVRSDTGQYLNAQGTWQFTAANALTATATTTGISGYAGVGRSALYAGEVVTDDFTVSVPDSVEVRQSFDTTAIGATPTGWRGWSSDGTSAFQVSNARSVSPANGFASNGTSVSTARGWSDTSLPADVDASAAVYLDSLIPAQVFVRGSNLDTTKPTYYGVTVTRGLAAQLVRVVNGTPTVLGTLKSSAYFSSQWLRVRLIDQSDHLQAMLYRADTRQWLAADGSWTDSPDFAFDLHDGAITAGGKAGVGRAAAVAGAVTFDDFVATPAGTAAGPVVSIQPLANPASVTGEVTFRATATGSPTRIEFRLNNVVRSVSVTSPASWTFDTTTLANGTYTLTVRAFDAAGNFGSADYTFTTNNPNAAPVPKPTIPRHYPNIRIAELAYGGNPMGAFEQQLLRTSVDLVVPNTQYLQTIQSVAPNTPQLIYSNVSNLYQGLLTDWLAYADKTGVSRELAFYHVTKATSFTGTSASSQPVTWFWGVYQTTGSTTTDVTSAARGGRTFDVQFGAAGTTTAIGYTDEFREMNVTLAHGGTSGWSGVWEYVSAVDANGNPTAWKTLRLNQDGTNGLRQSGTITFDPPADWVAASIGGSARLLYVRFRVTAGSADNGAELKTVFGRDYVRAAGGFSGVIPAFDYSADKNGDGYLDDAEYATRQPGMDARFVYESRLFYPYYGQMRFVTDPSASAVRKWAADYHVRLLNANPLADGVMMDNSTGKVPFPGISVVEPTTTYAADYGALIGAVNRAIAPRWVLANTAGGRAEATDTAANSGGVLEEFLLRPLQANWSEVGDVTNLVASRLSAAGSPYVVLDSSAADGSPTDPRTQIATLAYYYLLADPDRTFLMFFGGDSPSSSWTQHWSSAAAVNVGKPTGAMREFASGIDPLSPSLTYKVFARDYTNGLVLYKPLSYAVGIGEGTANDQTATTHQLGGAYRVVNADGTLGPMVTQVTLRNGEGAVLLKA